MQNKLPLYIVLSLLLLLILATAALYMGVYEFEKHSFFEIFKALINNDNSIPESDKFVLMDLRLPRIVMAILIGSALSVSGTCLQGMFKNPLASPDLIGITSGAILFGAISIVSRKPYQTLYS
jgi:iron complex transport system permease protein